MSAVYKDGPSTLNHLSISWADQQLLTNSNQVLAEGLRSSWVSRLVQVGHADSLCLLSVLHIHEEEGKGLSACLVRCQASV